MTLSDLTIENGLAQPGDGPAGSGGGIRDEGNTSLTLNSVVVTNNAASADGGGISMENVLSTPWTLNINNSTIESNRAGDAGGGVETDGSGNVKISNSQITANTPVNQGGGVWLVAIDEGAPSNPVVTTGGQFYFVDPDVVLSPSPSGVSGGGYGVVDGNAHVTGIVLTA